MISAEYDGKYEFTICFDSEGAYELIKHLQTLIDRKDTHIHLMTDDFGGVGLEKRKYIEKDEIVNMIRLQFVDETYINNYFTID